MLAGNSEQAKSRSVIPALAGVHSGCGAQSRSSSERNNLPKPFSKKTEVIFFQNGLFKFHSLRKFQKKSDPCQKSECAAIFLFRRGKARKN
jgi:hypothetical protein